MNIIETIDELRAQSVTPDQFRKMWGYTLEEYLDRMHQLIGNGHTEHTENSPSGE